MLGTVRAGTSDGEADCAGSGLLMIVCRSASTRWLRGQAKHVCRSGGGLVAVWLKNFINCVAIEPVQTLFVEVGCNTVNGAIQQIVQVQSRGRAPVHTWLIIRMR